MSTHEATVHALIMDEPEHATGCIVCTPPILQSVDPRSLTVGTVFLWDGAEHTVTYVHRETIRCAAEVWTNRGARLYFTRESANVSIVL